MARNRRRSYFFMASPALLAFTALSAPHIPKHPGAEYYLTPHVHAGETLSDITYRVISLHGPGMEDSVVQLPATGTYSFTAGTSPDVIPWSVSVRMDGKVVIQDAPGDYRDHGATMCFKGKCDTMRDASAPFYNPTFWGSPEGELLPGKSWTADISQPWEVGPAGKQTVTVLSVDKADGIIMLKREGEGVGPYEGKHDTATIKKDGREYRVTAKYGRAHWAGQATFKQGVVVSDELLCNTEVELSSEDTGIIKAKMRQYISLLQHPEPIAN